MKNYLGIIFFLALAISFSTSSMAAIPTEEGLLKNLNNPAPQNGQTIVKLKVTKMDESKSESFYRLTFSNENPNALQLLQQKFASAQMSATQLRNQKIEMDLFSKIKRDAISEASVFYSTLGFLLFNKGLGLEIIVEKSGGSVIKTKSQYNEEKMRLLRQYKSYLATTKSKTMNDSPLNPPDPKEKQRVQDLFRSNSLRTSPNVKLTKMGSEFVWHADWKNVHGYFSNEERRLRVLDVSAMDTSVKIELDQYGILNGVNEFPKNMALASRDGVVYRIQVLGVESRASKEKPLTTKFEEAKKNLDPNNKEETEVFLF